MYGQNGMDKLHSREQSVSERGNPIDAHKSGKTTETRPRDAQQKTIEFHAANGFSKSNESTTVRHANSPETSADSVPIDDPEPMVVDEDALIAERRRKREMIRAKLLEAKNNTGQDPPLLQKALLGNASRPATPSVNSPAGRSERSISPNVTAPDTPAQNSNPESPRAFILDNDEDLTKVQGENQPINVGDSQFAADYDPTQDMEEDRARELRRLHNTDEPANPGDEVKDAHRTILPSESQAEGHKPAAKAKKDFDMFAEDDDDMFAEESVAESSVAVDAPEGRELDVSMLDDWDDEHGYYRVIVGELMVGRYHIKAYLGKGMFSEVVQARDNMTGNLVAIKIIRNKEMMRKAGFKEMAILKKLHEQDAKLTKHLVRLEGHFEHKGHLCMVFEHLSMNLRDLMKKKTGKDGFSLDAVRSFASQMFIGLMLLKKCKIMHADLKPDNMLVDDSFKSLKICDLGSAADIAENNEATPYLVSRYYRAPEIILGMRYDYPIDMWSIGVTLFEMWTGKFLFKGNTNNHMLRLIMECRGKFSPKMLKKCSLASEHFNFDAAFKSYEKDAFDKDVVKYIHFVKPTPGLDLKSRILEAAKGMNNSAQMKQVNLLADLLDRCLTLNPEKRITPADALKHPFISQKI